MAYPNPYVPYVVDTDATNLAIGAVLAQVQDGEEKVIMYGSKAFSGSQQQGCTTRRELFAIIHFVTVLLLLVKPGVYTPYRPFVAKVARFVS